ncbi:MAG: S41 family peptidase [Candidatus Aminicenantales bacterium]
MMTANKIRLVFLAASVAVCLLFISEKSFLPGISPRESSRTNSELIGTIIRLIKSDYINEANPSTTMEGAYKGMLQSLDVLSSYLDQASVTKYLQPQKANFRDVGLILYKRYGVFPFVIGIMENSPAERGGIKIGDYISAVDDQTTLLWGLAEINLYLKDTGNKSAKFRIVRENSTLEIKLERAELYKKSFSYVPQKGTAGIVKIHHFYPSVTEAVQQKLLSQLKPQIRPLILDLRDCHEGSYEEASLFINLFLKAEKIGYFKQKEEKKEPLSCSKNAELEKLPLIIWTNQATVGPAEVVAGVLKKIKKAKVIGIQTPGLAAKQDLFPLEKGDALLLTTGIFCYPSGEELWGQGVSADIKIEVNHQTQKTYREKTSDLLSRL